MIHGVLSKFWGRKKAATDPPPPPGRLKCKEQSIWHLATSLRQSLRHSSKSKQKDNLELDCGSEVQEWGSRRSFAVTSSCDELASAKRSLHARSLCMSSESRWEEERLEWNKNEKCVRRSSSHRDVSGPKVHSMVTRRLKKGSVYDTLTSASGLDFSPPVVQLKKTNFVYRKDESESKTEMEEQPKNETDSMNPKPSSSKSDPKPEKCLTTHEKYPSWPVVDSESTSLPYRSHSWTGQTDYPKEKVGYSRPKKNHQYKISTNQLQPVLERGTVATGVPERRRSTESSKYLNEQFDFEAFHTPCIPVCYSDIPERDNSIKEESTSFFNRYEDVLRHQATPHPKNNIPPDTPFLDRLRMENSWSPPARSDVEISSENGTWMDSMESSSHGRVAKWQGSYSDLSTLSTQLSNRSSLFDSGHSTMPESGRLSPQSSCDSLLLEGPTRAQVVARHGCHREIVAHSARVQQPERYGSESVLYYATGSSVTSPKSGEEKSVYRSHASLTLSRDLGSNLGNSSSRASSNSFSSEDSFTRPRCPVGEDTSGSSSDVSNITCISNYKGKPNNLEKISPKKADANAKYNIRKESQSKNMDENCRKLVLPEVDKRQRVSDPDLKAIQKQAVMSFYQRMSLAESIKSETKSVFQPSVVDSEAPPPYEGPAPKKKPPKLSLPPKSKWPPRPQILEQPPKAPDSSLLSNHSKSVPNLVALKGQNFDCQKNYSHNIRHSLLIKDEIISWDQLADVLEKKGKTTEKAVSSSDPSEDCSSGLQYLKGLRKVHLKEVGHSNEVQVLTSEGVTLSAKRRPAPPPPPKQPPRRPPPPPPPQQVVVTVNEQNKNEGSQSSEKEDIDEIKSPKIPPKITDTTPLIYPKNSYMSYRSERKLSRQGFDGKYRRSSSDLTSFDDTNFEQMHNIRQHGPTVIFHSDLKSNDSEDAILNDLSPVPSQDTNPQTFVMNCSLDNEITNLDQNQNSVQVDTPTKDEDGNCQINYTPRLHRRREKTKEELECEKLAREYVDQYEDNVIKRLLISAPSHKRTSDHVKGLLNIELDQSFCHDDVSEHQTLPDNQREERRTSSEINNSTAMLNLTNNALEANENQIEEDDEKIKRKELLLSSVTDKVESLKKLLKSIRVEISQNEELGKAIASHLRELARPNEMEKYSLHVEEMEKIVNLLLSLSARLAKAENLLKNMPEDCRSDEKKFMEAKREKLRVQHGDACRLKENIDRRSNQVSTFLHKYFSETEFASYDYFMKTKTKLIVDVRDVDERINLGEEQLAALSMLAHLWKSANS